MARMRWDALAGIVKQNGYTKGVEIGCGKGLNAHRLLSLCRNLHLIGVDYWPPDYPNSDGTPRGPRISRTIEAKYHDRMKEFAERVTLMRMPSLEAARQFDEGSLDFVFIDGDHSYEGCKADIEAWSPKVRKGGLIAGHDFNETDYPGVCRAVREVFRWRSSFEPDDVWLVQT